MGYATKACPANRFQHAAAQFQDITSETLDLDTTFSGLPGVNYDGYGVFQGTAPHIQVVKSDGTAALYYYLNDGWYDDGSKEGAEKPGWCNSAGNLVGLTATQGVGFWLKNGSSDAQTLQGAGAVFAKEETQVVAPAKIFSINANVYPVAFNLNNADQVTFPDIVGVNYDGYGVFQGTAPHIQVVKSDGTAALYYYLNDGWYDDGSKEGAEKPGWCNNAGNLVDVTITAQSGFWVKATNGAFTFNYKR